jgi:Uma2 family endonuclease
MSAARQTSRRMTVAEFVAMIEPYPDEERWELLDGEPVLMAPQTERHQRVVSNLWRALDQLSRPRGCVALPGLGILNDAVDHYAPIPDIVVRCGAMLDGGYARDPVLIAEVLSPSTMNNDRGRKLNFYMGLESLRAILIAYPGEVRVEVWQRSSEGWSHLVMRTLEDKIDLPELEGTVMLADIYDGIIPARTG